MCASPTPRSVTVITRYAYGQAQADPHSVWLTTVAVPSGRVHRVGRFNPSCCSSVLSPFASIVAVGLAATESQTSCST
jgi:hypothetical protein